MGAWLPVIYRGDGAWIGILASGRIGVGVADKGRASLEGSGFVPMWPFMEHGLWACIRDFRAHWDAFATCDVPTPERLLELTVVSAVESGRPYWMQAAASWLPDMLTAPRFDAALVQSLVERLLRDPAVPQRCRHDLRKACASTRNPLPADEDGRCDTAE